MAGSAKAASSVLITVGLATSLVACGDDDIGGSDAGRGDAGPGLFDAGPGFDAGPRDAGPGDAGPGDASMDGSVDDGSVGDAATDGATGDGSMGDGGDGAVGDGAPPDAGAPAAPSTAGDVVISEIHAAPLGYDSDSDAEWFEIYNPSDTVTYDLNGCVIADRLSRIGDPTEEHTIANEVLVAPGDYIVLASNDEVALVGFDPDYNYGDTLTLSGDGEDPTLACGGNIIDTVNYDDPTFPPRIDGRTRALDSGFLDAVANDDGLNWCAGNVAFVRAMGESNFGTPGAENTCPAPVTPSLAGDLVIYEIHASPVGGAAEYIEFLNPSETETLNLNGCHISNSASTVLDASDPATHVISEDVIVRGFFFTTLASADDLATVGFLQDYSYDGAFDLDGSGDDPAIACGGVIIDTVDYGAAGFPTESAGSSWSVDPGVIDATANDDPSNWCLADPLDLYFTIGGMDNHGTPNEDNFDCP